MEQIVLHSDAWLSRKQKNLPIVSTWILVVCAAPSPQRTVVLPIILLSTPLHWNQEETKHISSLKKDISSLRQWKVENNLGHTYQHLSIAAGHHAHACSKGFSTPSTAARGSAHHPWPAMKLPAVKHFFHTPEHPLKMQEGHDETVMKFRVYSTTIHRPHFIIVLHQFLWKKCKILMKWWWVRSIPYIYRPHPTSSHHITIPFFLDELVT